MNQEWDEKWTLVPLSFKYYSVKWDGVYAGNLKQNLNQWIQCELANSIEPKAEQLN